MMAHSEQLIVGDFGIGSNGPTILLKILSPDGAEWLRGVFLGMNKTTETFALNKQPEVSLRRVAGLELRQVEHGLSKHVHQVDQSPRFVWMCSADEWETKALLLDPFLKGDFGHHYLAAAINDDATIEVSFGEGDVVIKP